MTNHNSAAEKRIVEQLSFGAKTSKRVGWEAWEFSIAGSHQVEVTNASYGFEKDAHTYTVGVDKRAGIILPTECDCPADLHREPDCKHKVALATVGGVTVLNAAVECGTATAALSVSDRSDVATAADKLQTDGGVSTVDDEPETCPNGDSRCPRPDGDGFPCFDCFELSEVA